MKLTKRDVLYIFSQRAQVNNHESNALTSRQMAAKYGISERTVRDIWSRRSRRNLTQSAWTVEEVLSESKGKRMGRPPGAKDTKPRHRTSRTSGSEQETASSDGGTTRQSDTTGSSSNNNNNTSQQEHSSSSNQENSSSNSNQEISSSDSGESSPTPRANMSAAPSDARNDQLNEAVLSLLHHDWKHGAPAPQQARKMEMQNHVTAPTSSSLVQNPPNSSLDSSSLQGTPFRFPHALPGQWKGQALSQADSSLHTPVKYEPDYAQPLAYQSSSFGTYMASNTVPLASNSIHRQEDTQHGNWSSFPPHSGEWYPAQRVAGSRAVGGPADPSNYGASVHQPHHTSAVNYGQHHLAAPEPPHCPLSTPTQVNVAPHYASTSQLHALVPPTPPTVPYSAWHHPSAPVPQQQQHHHQLPSQQVLAAGSYPDSSFSRRSSASVEFAVPPHPMAYTANACNVPENSSAGLRGPAGQVPLYGQPGVVGEYMQRAQTQGPQQQYYQPQPPPPAHWQSQRY